MLDIYKDGPNGIVEILKWGVKNRDKKYLDPTGCCKEANEEENKHRGPVEIGLTIWDIIKRRRCHRSWPSLRLANPDKLTSKTGDHITVCPLFRTGMTAKMR